MPDTNPDGLPLEGLRVLDFSQTWTGPTATRQLADWGAAVLKIEIPERPDIMRLSSPLKGDTSDRLNSSVLFAIFNTNKLSATVDLRSAGGREQLGRILAWADIVVESFAPGVAARLGIDYASARAINPSVIVVSHSLLGQTGPHSALRGMGYLTSAMSGWQSATRYADDSTPYGPYSAYGDFISWGFTALSILAALEYRRRTGRGMYIDQAQMESSNYFALHVLADAWVNHNPQLGQGNLSRSYAPHGCYPCLGIDSWCAIAVTSDQKWQTFCSVIKKPPWVEEYRDIAARLAGRPAIDKAISEWTMAKTADDVAARLQAAGLLASKVRKSSDILADERLARRAFRRLPHSTMGDYLTLVGAFTIRGRPDPPFRPAPLMGEHTTELTSLISERLD
ncbi:MAG: hypothetical protein GEU28_02360 [Dehalococcoidia bacterium]|nr:hypothetical protein [Dehalococcoidia bacterium]